MALAFSLSKECSGALPPSHQTARQREQHERNHQSNRQPAQLQPRRGFRPSRDCSLRTLCGHGKGCIANDDNHLVGVAIGIVPLMVGIALLIYAYRFAPKERQ